MTSLRVFPLKFNLLNTKLRTFPWFPSSPITIRDKSVKEFMGLDLLVNLSTKNKNKVYIGRLSSLGNNIIKIMTRSFDRSWPQKHL